jgi:hypothetical protein
VPKFRQTLIAVYSFVLLVALSVQATTINVDELALWAGGTVGLGSGVTVNAAIASGGEISAGSRANLRSIYTENKIWLGNNATVNGTVLANKQAQAGSGLNLLGNWTGSSVSIGSNSNITGDIGAGTGKISLGSNTAMFGDVLGNNSISIGSKSTITGDVRPGIGYKISKPSNVTITGSTQPGSFSFNTFDLPALDQLQQSTIGTDNIYGPRYSTTTLLPDEYRDWSFDKNNTLNLSAGAYSLKNFWVDRDSVVNVDTSAGDVILNIAGQFSTGTNVSFSKSGSGNLFINVFGHNVWLEDNVKLSAVLKVYGGDFGVDKSAQLAGRFYATGDIWLGRNTQLEYISSQVIPEPSTLVIFAVMGLFLSCKKK